MAHKKRGKKFFRWNKRYRSIVFVSPPLSLSFVNLVNALNGIRDLRNSLEIIW